MNRKAVKNGRSQRKPLQPKTVPLHIKKWGINGEGVAFYKRKPVFVENALPGEEVLAEIKEETPSFIKAVPVTIKTPSARRKDNSCRYANECGGCAMGHVQYKEQAKMKEKILAEALKKYADYTGKILPIIKNPSPLGYRNALKLPLAMYEDRLQAGMFAKDSNKFVSVSRCIIHSKELERAKNEILEIMNEAGLKSYDKKTDTGCRSLIIRCFDDQVQATIVTARQEIPQSTIDAIMNVEGVVSLWQSVKLEDQGGVDVFGSKMIHLAGSKTIELRTGGYTLQLLPRSFYQLNTTQAEVIYRLAADWMEPCNVMVEAYAGIGAISFFAHDKAKEIYGIENIPDAVENAAENAKANHIDNVHFICGDSGQELLKLEKEKQIDTLIVDPPRSGLDETMIQAVLASKVKTLIYISCNPSTLAKNIADLSKAYQIEKVQPVDIFSQTAHVETVVLMSRKGK